MWLFTLLLFSNLLGAGPKSFATQSRTNSGSAPIKRTATKVEKQSPAADIEILKSDKSGIEFIYTHRELFLDGLPYIPNTHQETEVGKPALPVKYVVIGIPISAKVNVQVISSVAKERSEVDIPPVFGFTEKEQDESIYSKSAFWPSEIVSIEEQTLYRGQEVLKLRINPLRYNPINKTLLIYNRIRVRINFYGGKGIPKRDRLFESVFKSVLINYDQAKNWRAPSIKSDGKYYPDSWYKIELQEEGIYKVSSSQLKALGMQNTDPKTIKLYNGGSKMKTDSSDTLCEIPICVLSDTSILFYGTPLSGWGKNGEAFINPYTNTNVYWLTYGGEPGRRDSIFGVPVGGETPGYFLDTLHVEEDINCPAKSGLGWIWEKLIREKENSSLKKDYSFNVQGIYEDNCCIRFAVYGWYADGSHEEESNSIHHNIRVYLNGKEFFSENWRGGQENPLIFEDSVTGLHNGSNTFTFEMYRDSVMKDVIFFDWFEVIYKKKYDAHTGNLKFSGENADQKFELHKFDELPVIFNTTNEVVPKLIYGAVYGNGTVKFKGDKGTYYASTNFKSPSVKSKSPYDLRNLSNHLDFVIITHSDFLNYANSLKRYRERQGLKTGVFSVNDICDNFSWGLKHSPYAIKNFLKFAYDNWETGYCLLLGAGTYNYKDESLEKNRVPPWEEGYRVGEYGYPPQHQYCYDWWFTDKNLAIGRITAKTKEEARDIVCEKIPKYEKNMGVWQNHILLIADDEEPDGDAFVNHAERIANYIPGSFDIFKVYLMNYPLDGILKPKARDDLVRHWSKGSFLTLFGGHGNLLQLCGENVFWNPTDIQALNNGIKLPFSHFWSCGVGCFEREYKDGMADYLQKINNKGSIGTIASTRSTGGSSGIEQGIIKYFLIEPQNTIGKAVYATLLNSGFPKNINSFSDPSTKLPDRSINVIIDSLPDVIKGGMPLKVCGRAPEAKFAHITVRSSEYVYHYAPASCEYKMRGEMINDQLCKDVLFEGITPVKNGKWSQEFFIPILDFERDSLIYGGRIVIDSVTPEGDTLWDTLYSAKISVFAWNDRLCGSMAVDTLRIMPCGDNPEDTSGPKIELFAFGKSLKDGSLVPSSFTLTGVLEDESGINTFNKITPERLILRLVISCGKLQPISIPLVDYFQYDLGSGTIGSFQYSVQLGDWDIEDTLKVFASDNLGNRSECRAIVKVESSARLEVKKVMNYPNPVRGEHTSFHFFLSKPAMVSVKIYTVAGRLIRTISPQNKPSGPNKIYWDTRDALGNRVGNGIYIYKVLASSEGLTKEETSKISKLMMLR